MIPASTGRRHRIGWVWLALGLAGCVSAPPALPPTPSPAARHDYALRESVLEDALGEIGRPYVYGGADADGFDCSGLTHYVFGEAGVDLPRTAAQQLRTGLHVPYAQAVPGDLVFYRFGRSLHVTIYVGDGKVVHAPSTGQTVKVQDVDTPYWRERYVATVRVLN